MNRYENGKQVITHIGGKLPLTEAFALLNIWKNNPKNQKLILGDGVAFINKGGKGRTKTKN